MAENIFDAVLAPYEQPSKEKAARLAASLRRDSDFGTVMQLMGTPATTRAGEGLQKQAYAGLQMAAERDQEASRERQRAMERDQAQKNWQANYDEQRRQFGITDQRQREQAQGEQRKRYQHAVDPITGVMRLYDVITGKWQDEMGGTTPAPGGPREPGFAPPPPMGYGKQTEAEQKSQFYAQTMTQALPEMVGALRLGYTPQRIDQFAAGPASSGVGGIIQQNTPRSFGDPRGRAFYTAGRQVLAGILRKESGAAITDDEWQNYGPMYLPWPGDSPEEIERKMQVLYQQTESTARGSGHAYRYWTAPQYQAPGKDQGKGGGIPTPQAGPVNAPRAGDAYLPPEG